MRKLRAGGIAKLLKLTCSVRRLLVAAVAVVLAATEDEEAVLIPQLTGVRMLWHWDLGLMQT